MRTLSTPVLNALAGSTVPLILLLEMGFDTPLRANSSAIDIDWGGHTYLRTGNLGSVDPVKDSSGELMGLKFTLSGVPSESVSLSIGVSVRKRSCKLWCAILDPVSHAVLDAPLIFSGELDQMPLSQQDAGSTIAVTAIHQGQLFRRVRSLSQTESEQKRLYPGDTSRRFLVSQANHKDVWPAASYGKR